MIALVFICFLALVAAATRDYGLGPTGIAVGVIIPFALAVLALGLALH
jgi:hypothetical protein